MHRRFQKGLTRRAADRLAIPVVGVSPRPTQGQAQTLLTLHSATSLKKFRSQSAGSTTWRRRLSLTVRDGLSA
uniref:Phage-like protein n=1 Tax=uncultured marine virus TaxID=186617 RepID=A0A0F7L4K1_9VIRU|nr:phage-like protein [uncultured marine virus]